MEACEERICHRILSRNLRRERVALCRAAIAGVRGGGQELRTASVHLQRADLGAGVEGEKESEEGRGVIVAMRQWT